MWISRKYYEGLVRRLERVEQCVHLGASEESGDLYGRHSTVYENSLRVNEVVAEIARHIGLKRSVAVLPKFVIEKKKT